MESRIAALEKCDAFRQKELCAIHEQFDALKRDIQSKIWDYQRRSHEKEYEHCGKKFKNMEANIIETINEDLAILRSWIEVYWYNYESKKWFRANSEAVVLALFFVEPLPFPKNSLPSHTSHSNWDTEECGFDVNLNK